QIKEIVSIQLEAVRERLKKQDITAEFTDALISFLTKRGFDVLYGARPLKRAIQSFILNQLAMKVVDGTVKEGDAVIIDAVKGAVSISHAQEFATQNA
ncbi:MAG: ATP-dependent Clp protease ATP-binding subunit, partial [Candidatus Uhrbacteria bacterium]|nr:ATP-dependent Clp protease ATP-binding subunit [Candidatus Uhrbacteria bacterium]